MQLTYDQVRRFTTEDDASPDQTRDLPLVGFLSGSLIGLGLWTVIGLAVWTLLA